MTARPEGSTVPPDHSTTAALPEQSAASPAAAQPPTYAASAPAAMPPASGRGSAWPWLGVAGFIILAGAIAYTWLNPPVDARVAEQAQANAGAISDVNQRLGDLQTKLSGLDQRVGAVSPADIAKLTAHVDALDGRLVDQSQFGSRLDTISGRIEALSGRDQTATDALKQQQTELASRIATLEGASGDLGKISQRLDHVARLQEAAFALSVGRPVGNLPGAPPALTRFAQTPPPTEAQLRISFAQAKQQALEKQQPDNTKAPFVDRIWERAQGLVTVRQGSDVVVGNATAIALGHAQAALDIGDLQGAVNDVQSLKGDPAQAMASWLASARNLLGARAALAEMADQT